MAKDGRRQDHQRTGIQGIPGEGARGSLRFWEKMNRASEPFHLGTPWLLQCGFISSPEKADSVS